MSSTATTLAPTGLDASHTCDFTTANGAAGPALVDWLRSIGRMVPYDGPGDEQVVGLSKSWVRSIYRWKRGGDASFWTVDRLATELGYHVSELPADVWLGHSPHQAGATWRARLNV